MRRAFPIFFEKVRLRSFVVSAFHLRNLRSSASSFSICRDAQASTVEEQRDYGRWHSTRRIVIGYSRLSTVMLPLSISFDVRCS